MHVPVGTPYSIAPECLSGAYTVQCDLWSVGVLTFTLLTGQPPFTGRCVTQLLMWRLVQLLMLYGHVVAMDCRASYGHGMQYGMICNGYTSCAVYVPLHGCGNCSSTVSIS